MVLVLVQVQAQVLVLVLVLVLVKVLVMAPVPVLGMVLALALVLFGSWRPNRIALGALLFGITMALELRLQNVSGLPDWIVPLLLPSLPYLVPIIVLVFISLDSDRNRQNKPGCLGKIFHPND